MQLPIELSHPCYHDDEAARVQLESIRWPDGPYCPICGAFDAVKPMAPPPKAKGGGWHWCGKCRRLFTVRVGSDAPIVVQSMTNTDTADIPSTVQQCAALARAGSELVRVTVNNEEAAAAVPHIVDLEYIPAEGSDHGQGKITVCDGLPVGHVRLAALDINMDPLMVAACFGKRVDAFLCHYQPVADP